jgi:hypothetical protein
MMPQDDSWFRLAVLCTLVEEAPTALGRTAVMKLAYLLQTVKGLPLGYDFRLYTYGPFDSDVLNDLATAETLDAVHSQLVFFDSGYGYEFKAGEGRDFVRKKTGELMRKYHSELRWALEEFGRRTAAELELLSTIIYADREAKQQSKQLPETELAQMVHQVKPRFSETHIAGKVRELSEKGLLLALSPSE